MKINWGTGIVISFALFMTFILYFVIKVQSDSKYDNDLVVENYYVHDMKYNDEMQQVENVNKLVEKPKITIIKEGVKVIFPNQFKDSAISGKISLYRPSNKKLDFSAPIKLKDSGLEIKDKKFIKGLWEVILEWEYEGRKYLLSEEIYVN